MQLAKSALMQWLKDKENSTLEYLHPAIMQLAKSGLM